MKKSLLLLGLLAVFASSAMALPEVILGAPDVGEDYYYQTWNRTLSPDTLYVLQGIYMVEDGYTLTIPAGTIIKGTPAATLVIKRGGDIMAEGTADNPIVMTSNQPVGSKAPGDWGGVVILGYAQHNQLTDPFIEGGIIPCQYGGNDDDDDSGVFKYVRIEYPGYRFEIDNEINGLTCGAVGRGTEIHHVQVSYSFDDSFEFFGGAVNVSHLVAFGGTDDEFDTDLGYRGNMQFLFGMRDPYNWDPNGTSNGFESDNEDVSDSQAEPYTHPKVSNATLIGPARDDSWVDNLPIGEEFGESWRPRKSSRISVFNTAFCGYETGISLRDIYTKQAALDTILVCMDVSTASWKYKNDEWADSMTIMDIGKWDYVNQWYQWDGFRNIGNDLRLPSSLMLTDMSQLNYPNPVPMAGSELVGSANFTHAYLQDPHFTPVTYRGAFDPALMMEEQWTAGWTNFNPQGFVVGAPDETVAGYALHGCFPNPFNPKTEIRFSLPEAGTVSLQVFDLQGRKVADLANDQTFEAGTHSVTWNGTDDSGQPMASGIYFTRILAGEFAETQKMTLVK